MFLLSLSSQQAKQKDITSDWITELKGYLNQLIGGK